MNKCIASTDDTTIKFLCPPERSVLDAALDAGWELPYSCRMGVCESCRATIVSGEVEPAAAADGTALLCRSQALTDLRIVPTRIEKATGPSRKQIRAQFYRVTWPAADVAVLDLRFAAGTKVPFRAGQYLHVLLDGEEPRAFSMANPPRASDGAQLHVRVAPGGLFGATVLPRLVRGDELTLDLPLGDFYLRDSERPVLMVAGGTGFAPMHSVLEDALVKNPGRLFTLYWGARDSDGLYAMPKVERWLRRYSNFQFVPVISGDPVDGMRSGRVHEAVLADHEDLSGFDVYACGGPGLVSAARSDFISERGLPSDRFFADTFATPADAAGSATTQPDK